MAKNFKNLNSKEKYEYLFDTYKQCKCCKKTKTYNCFFDRKVFKLRDICTICQRKSIKEYERKMVLDVISKMDIDL